MELRKSTHLEFKGQDDTTVNVRICFQGEKDRVFYCKELNIPKAELVNLTGGTDSTGRKLTAAYMPPLISEEEAERWRHDNPEQHEEKD